MAVVAAPGVEDAHGVGHAGYALWIFAVPLLVAALIEAPIAVASDRLRRERLLRVALAVLAGALALCALAPTPWLLSMGLAVAGAAGGVATSSAEGALIVACDGRADRAMARWAQGGAAGDTLAPLVVGAVLWLGGSYRGALVVVAVATALQALATGRRAPAPPSPGDEDDAPREPIRAVLARPRLWLLLMTAGFCTLLDELVIALAALRMTRDLGATEALTAATLTACCVGELLGAAALDTLLHRWSSRAILVGSALLTTVSLAALVLAPSPWSAAAALFVLGVAAAPQYPLVQAAAYDAAPGRPGLVNAAGRLFVALEIGLPLAIGAIAAGAGLAVALAALGVQPLFVAVAAIALLRRRA